MPDNSNYQFRAVPLNLLDYVKKKTKSSEFYFRYLLDRTMMMFEYKNMPDTIVPSILERYLQVNGVACITEAKGKLYCFSGSWGGEQDVYYRPTRFIIANPHISQLTEDKTFTKEVIINGDEEHTGVLLRNDTEWASLTPLIARYAVLMCENCLTIRSADIMLRILAMLTAGTDKERRSAEAYLAKIEAGELGVIGTNSFKQSVNMQSPPSNNGSYLTQFIELQQYLKGSFFNELGLRANYNMKRESINSNESQLNDDMLHPLIDDMLAMRREALEKVNEMFGTNITVEFNSAWADNEIENDLTMEVMEAEADQITEAPEETDNIEAAPEDEEVLIDDTENEESTEEIPAEEEVAEEVTDEDGETVETDILPEAVEELTEAVEELTEAITAEEPEEKEGEDNA